MHKRGFSLIELLVVMALLIILGAIGIGSIMRGPRQQGLMGVEGIVASAIRQARHTAMNSGAPVEVRLRQDPQGTWVLQGVGELVLWAETFEDPQDPAFQAEDLSPFGFTGQGLQVLASNNNGRRPPLRSAALPARPGAFNQPEESLTLLCMVRPPLRFEPSADASHIYVDVLALMQGEEVLMEVFLRPLNNPRTHPEPMIYQLGGSFFGQELFGDSPADTIIGGSWLGVQAVYGDGVFRLLLDGREVASSQLSYTPISRSPPLQLAWGTQDLGSIPFLVDEVRVSKLGVASPFSLPEGVTANAPRTLTAWPDGSMSSDGGLVFRQNAAQVVIGVSASGRVNSSMSILDEEDP